MKTISAALFGAPLDPFSNQTRQHIALVAFLAWIGLGADGLSSSCYGPEEAFLRPASIPISPYPWQPPPRFRSLSSPSATTR
jgi:hypothetical protein